MRFRAIIFGLVLASAATAQTPRERAVEDAVARLEAQVRHQTLADGTTLGDLIDQLDARERLLDTLHRADQIGGVRRVGADHVQVQYRIDGRRIREALADSARIRTTPASELDLLASLDDLQFVAVGSSLPSRGSNPRHRLEARVIESLRGSAALASVTIDEQALRSWLARIPVLTETEGAVTRHSLRPDYADLLAATLSSHESEALLLRLQSELPTTFALVIDASQSADTDHAAATQAIPEWVGEFVRVTGSAAPESTPLLTARASEERARRQLRLALGALLLEGHAVDDVLQDQPDRRELLDRLIQSARVLSTEYQADGSAVTTIALDGRRIWDVVAP